LVWDKNPVGGLSLDGDGGASVEGECTSEILKQGEDVNLDELADNRNIGIDEVPGKVEKTTVSGDSLGARRVAMAVVAADLAGNISQISNVDCLQVVATNGFWDTYKANGGEAETGCACSTPGTRTSLGSGLVPIALVVVAWGMRRRARKRSGS
jgi:MYXO-CTERM domain-containing protein